MGTVPEVWNRNWSGQTVSEVWNMSWSEQRDGIWQVHTSESNWMHKCLPKVESLVSLLVSQCMYDVRWIMKDWIVVVLFEIEIQFMKYIFFKNSLAYPSFCVLFVLFLKLRWPCILNVSRGFDRWCESQWIMMEKLHFIFFLIL